MKGAQASGMAGVQRLEKVKSFPASHFPYDDSVRPESQGGFQKVPDGNRRNARLLAACLQSDQVIFLDLNFCGLFDDDEPLFGSDEVREGSEQRRFAGSGSARDDHVLAELNRRLELQQQLSRERPDADQVLGAIELALKFPD